MTHPKIACQAPEILYTILCNIATTQWRIIPKISHEPSLSVADRRVSSIVDKRVAIICDKSAINRLWTIESEERKGNLLFNTKSTKMTFYFCDWWKYGTVSDKTCINILIYAVLFCYIVLIKDNFTMLNLYIYYRTVILVLRVLRN